MTSSTRSSLSLSLNGVTAWFSLFGFAKNDLVEWRPAILLAVVTTLVAPLGAWLAQIIGRRAVLKTIDGRPLPVLYPSLASESAPHPAKPCNEY